MNPGSEKLLDRIFEKSEEALQAARIEHDDILHTALTARDKMIAGLFGLNSDQALPAFSPDIPGFRLPEFNAREQEVINRIRKVQRLLERALEVRSGRLLAEQNHLRTGSRFIEGIREYVGRDSGKYLDKKG